MFAKLILSTAIDLAISVSSFAQNNFTMKSINNNAPVKCSKAIIIKANSEKVWNVISNIDKWASILADRY